MKVTINAQNRALEKQKKVSFVLHLGKDLKHDNKQNQCLASKLKFKFDTFDHEINNNYLTLSQKRNMKQFQLLKQKCKLSTSKKIKQQIFLNHGAKPTTNAYSQGHYNRKDKKNNPEIFYEDKLISSINQLNNVKIRESGHSTKANSRQKSRANSMESSLNCCKMVKTQKEQAYIKITNKQSACQVIVKEKPKQKKINKIMSPEISKMTRIIMLDWLFQLSAQIQLPKQALYNAIDYIDKYVIQSQVNKSNYQKLGLACLFLATKLQMSSHPQINTFLEAIDNQLDKDVLIETQRKIVNTLKFRLNPPTLFQYMNLALLTLRTFKSEYKNIGWLNHLPSVEKDSRLWKKIFWVLDGVTIEGLMVHKYGKSDICLAILYISIVIQTQLLKSLLESQQISFLQEKVRLQSTVDSDFSFMNGEKQSFSQGNEDEQKITLSFQCFFRYATISNRSLRDLQSCIQELKKWQTHNCKCHIQQFDYHQQLKHIALIK